LTLNEAVKIFDRLEPLNPRIHADCKPEEKWLAVDGQRIGIPYCCEEPVVTVVMNDQAGFSMISCRQCGRTISYLAQQWVITNWGSKGIKLPRPTPEADRDPDEIEVHGGITHLPAEFREVAKKANAAGLAGYEVVQTEIGTDWESIARIELYRREFRTRIQITYRKAEP